MTHSLGESPKVDDHASWLAHFHSSLLSLRKITHLASDESRFPMDPISATLAAISLATAVKDIVELGKKISCSFSKVSVFYVVLPRFQVFANW